MKLRARVGNYSGLKRELHALVDEYVDEAEEAEDGISVAPTLRDRIKDFVLYIKHSDVFRR